jgi:hypothetical protein
MLIREWDALRLLSTVCSKALSLPAAVVRVPAVVVNRFLLVAERLFSCILSLGAK